MIIKMWLHATVHFLFYLFRIDLCKTKYIFSTLYIFETKQGTKIEKHVYKNLSKSLEVHGKLK